MHLLIALALGVISAFAFEPVGFWPLMPLAFAGLLELIARAPTQRRAIGLGWWFAVGQFTVGLNWIATAFTFQAAMPAWLGWIAVVALALYLAVYPMLATGLAWRIGRDKPLVLVLALAGAWIVNEWLRATAFTGFAWNPVGVILIDSRLLDASRWIGTYGLGALVVLSGGALWLAWRRAFQPAALVAAAVLAFMLVPAATLQPAGTPRPIRIVQPNIGQDVKWQPGFEDIANARLNGLTRPRDRRQELIFWPEAAVTTPLSDTRPGASNYVQQERTQATAAVTDRDVLLTGGVALRSKDGRRADSAANSVFVLGPGG
ncbi:MAG: apolipoprotein N-acyltransferase, partial [Sphingomicrobium sp.]